MKTSYLIGAVVVFLAVAGGIFVMSKPAEEAPPLVEISSKTPSSMFASLTLMPEQPVAGEEATLTFSFQDAEGNPVEDLMVHHARRIHTLIVSEDLGMIGHIHPEDFGETNSVRFTFPEAGRYLVGVDVMSADDTLAKQFVVSVTGTQKMSETKRDFALTKCFQGYAEQGEDRYVNPVLTVQAEVSCPNGYEVALSLPEGGLRAGEEAKLSYMVKKDGEPVEDLEPYLDAAIHFAIVPSTLDDLLHRHGVAVEAGEMEHAMEMEGESMGMDDGMHMDEGMKMDEGMAMEEGEHHHGDGPPEAFGPMLQSESIVFPGVGLYQIFSQAKHGGKIIFMNFMVDITEGFDAALAQKVTLEITERSLMPEIVTINQDEGVILRVSGDEMGEFHIAGYELEKELNHEGITELRFTADKAGRYNLELHPAG